jgi:hypothetical protein
MKFQNWCKKINKISREIGWGDMDWIDLAEDRDQWTALVNTLKNIWVS